MSQVLTTTQLEAFETRGFLIVRQLFTSAEIEGIKAAFDEFNKDGPVPGLSDIRGDFNPEDPLSFYPRVMHPHRQPQLEIGRLALEFMLDQRLEGVLHALFQEEPIGAQTMYYFKPPGARGQALHQDNFYLRVAPGTCMAAWLAIDAADPENGGMMVVPGSHREAIVCPEPADASASFTTDFVPVPEGMRAEHVRLEPGDVLFFNGSLIHGSTPNTSATRFRRSLIAHYIPESCSEVGPWYRPLLRFSHLETTRAVAQGGGPCGTPQPSGPH
jgi:phytanoyl-CoA hydroxylase